MQKINKNQIRQWAKQGNYWLPKSISIVCPHCSEKGVITLTMIQLIEVIKTCAFQGVCPSCNKHISAWIIDPTNHRQTDIKDFDAFYIYPIPKLGKIPNLENMDEVPEEVLNDYKSALNVFNIGEWNASAVCCRRVIEGIMHDMLPVDTSAKSLYQQLIELPKHKDLSKPIIDLANAIRSEGNKGAHFNMDKPDLNSVSNMIGLIEFILDYLYALPHRIESLTKDISQK